VEVYMAELYNKVGEYIHTWYIPVSTSKIPTVETGSPDGIFP
jgi:hypothetical protein